VAFALVAGLNRPASTTGDNSPAVGPAAHLTTLDAYVLPLAPTCTVVAAQAEVAAAITITDAAIPEDMIFLLFIRIESLYGKVSTGEP
jgi:hypothetical protein